MLVLGIETSCDETALALVDGGVKVLGTQVASSLQLHQRYGGVVPEIASRAHTELITCELEVLLDSAKITPSQIDRIAVTYGPGLSGSLLVGIAAAKALGFAWGRQMVGVNHLQAHLYAALMENPGWPLDAPMIGLVISGGHTAVIEMQGIYRYAVLGQTRDDAVGEAFDKVAKLLGLGFPGGPEIERAAIAGNPKAYRFRVPRIRNGSAYDFSLSGMKTAVLYKIQEMEKKGNFTKDISFVADMSASFQSAIVEEVVDKTVKACQSKKIARLLVGGGVVANSLLRRRLGEVCGGLGIELAVPRLSLCTDNGAMVAGLGHHLKPVPLNFLTAVPDLRVEMN